MIIINAIISIRDPLPYNKNKDTVNKNSISSTTILAFH